MNPPALSSDVSINTHSEPVSVGNWLLTMIVSAIPLVGIIMLLVWAFSGDTHPSKRNYCKAVLILAAIAIVLFGLLAVLGGGLAALTGATQPPVMQ